HVVTVHPRNAFRQQPVNRHRDLRNIGPAALDRDVLLLSSRLSGTAHNDPADRMLMAAAQINNIPLVREARGQALR
ncbi:MAG: hypothetical protein ABI322_08535, partial [Gemmatimonadaceae bacterium]